MISTLRLPGTVLRSSGEWPLHFGARALHAQILRREIKLLTTIVGDGQGFAILVQPQFGRPDLRVGHQLTNRTVPATLTS